LFVMIIDFLMMNVYYYYYQLNDLNHLMHVD
jgi:hypothetical protein